MLFRVWYIKIKKDTTGNLHSIDKLNLINSNCFEKLKTKLSNSNTINLDNK